LWGSLHSPCPVPKLQPIPIVNHSPSSSTCSGTATTLCQHAGDSKCCCSQRPKKSQVYPLSFLFTSFPAECPSGDSKGSRTTITLSHRVTTPLCWGVLRPPGLRAVLPRHHQLIHFQLVDRRDGLQDVPPSPSCETSSRWSFRSFWNHFLLCPLQIPPKKTTLAVVSVRFGVFGVAFASGWGDIVHVRTQHKRHCTCFRQKLCYMST
jgi:hypothetical protein